MELSQAIETIRAMGTNGLNCDVETEDIVSRLLEWSQRFQFEVIEVDHDTVTLKLNTLPENLTEFCQEVYAFCPDIIDQGYGCLADIIEMGEDLDPDQLDLMDGLDPEAEDFGLSVMERDLPRIMAITLWWD